MLRVLTFVTCIFLAGAISGTEAVLCNALNIEVSADLTEEKEERSEKQEEKEEYRQVKQSRVHKYFLAYTYNPFQQRVKLFYEDYRMQISCRPIYILHENFRL